MKNKINLSWIAKIYQTRKVGKMVLEVDQLPSILNQILTKLHLKNLKTAIMDARLKNKRKREFQLNKNSPRLERLSKILKKRRTCSIRR